MVSDRAATLYGHQGSSSLQPPESSVPSASTGRRLFGVVLVLAAIAIGTRYVPMKQSLVAAGLSPTMSAILLITLLVILVFSGVRVLRQGSQGAVPAA